VGLARRFLGVEDFAQARQYAERALRIAPDDADALAIRRRALEER
jgi:Tfp pilus assembly protein PilF